MLKNILDEEGKPRTCERVRISSLNGKYRTYGGEGFGNSKIFRGGSSDSMNDYTKKIFTPEALPLKERSTGTGGFVHYYGSAKFHAQAGQAFAKALLNLTPLNTRSFRLPRFDRSCW